MKKKTDEEIKKNIKWFKKFSLEKRLNLSEIDRKVTEFLRRLTVKSHAKPRRAG
jgi:hypothetical protein